MLNLIYLLFFTLPLTHAVVLYHDSFDEFLSKSKADPARLYMFKISASWCGPCKLESKELNQLAADDRSAVAQAYWNEVEKDLISDESYEDFLHKIKIPGSSAVPFNIAFRNGIPLGSLEGYDMQSLQRFVNDALNYVPTSLESSKSATVQIPTLLSHPKQNEGACVIGISGYDTQNQTQTDDFGRANLKMFHDLFPNPKFEKLMAPPIANSETNPAPSGHGVFYGTSPFSKFADLFSDPRTAIETIVDLSKLSGDNVRLLLTGHGAIDGMIIGYQKRTDSRWYDALKLDAHTFEIGLNRAREAGKTVRGLLTQCYSGQYAEAFMPAEGTVANACAAFASLPEKKAEGCYSTNFVGDRKDYLGVAARLKNSASNQTGRDLHYAIVSQALGHDVPMLSSEYFLLFGDVARKLSRDKALDVLRMVSPIWLKSGAVVYVNRLNNTIIKAGYQRKAIPVPRMTLVDCVNNAFGGTFDFDAPDRHHFSLFYLWRRAVGRDAKKINDCTPSYHLAWPQNESNPPNEIVSFEFNQNSTFDLTAAERTVDVSGLKPEANLMLSRILPYYFSKNGHSREISDFVTKLANEIKPFDSPRALAITMLSEKVQAEDESSGYKRDLAAAFLYNLSSAEINDRDISFQRLAHLIASAIAEVELRQEAATDQEASKLVKQLEALKDCENDIF